jgi:hypothetical protein
MRMANNRDNKWAMACIVDGGGGVNIIDPFFLLARRHTTPFQIVMVLVLLLVGIVRAHNLYLNPKLCKYQIFSTDIIAPVE